MTKRKKSKQQPLLTMIYFGRGHGDGRAVPDKLRAGAIEAVGKIKVTYEDRLLRVEDQTTIYEIGDVSIFRVEPEED